MMILSQDGMVAVNSDNVVMFEVKESETLPHETRLCATILITNGARFSCSIGTFRSPDRTELAKLALDYISFSISTGHKCSVQVPTEDEIENDEKLEISGSALLVPRNLTDYQVKVDIALADGKIDSNTHVGGAHGHKFQLFDSRGGGVTGLVGCPFEGDKDKPVGDYHKVESSKESAHIHSLKTFSIESGLLTVYNALKTGESVYLLRFNDGKSYYALERAIV